MLEEEERIFVEEAGMSTVECSLRVLAVHEMKLCAFTKLQEVDAGSGDILAHLPRLDADAVFSVEIGLLEKLGWDQVHLAEIGL